MEVEIEDLEIEEVNMDSPTTPPVTGSEEVESVKEDTPPPKRVKRRRKLKVVVSDGDDKVEITAETATAPVVTSKRSKGKGRADKADDNDQTPKAKKDAPLLPFFIDSEAVKEKEKFNWEWAQKHPIGCYDIPDIVAQSIPTEQQLIEASNFAAKALRLTLGCGHATSLTTTKTIVTL